MSENKQFNEVDMNRKSLLFDESDFTVTDEVATKVEEETEQNIPSAYITVKLPSNGRIDGIPDKLHFRDYSANEALDINVPVEEDLPKAITNVLTNMCWEHFDVSELPVQDVLYILYVLQATFISNEITKDIYVDETLPDGTDEGQLDNESNIENVSIPISTLKMTYLGLDKDDNELPKKIKIPFTVKDSITNDSIEFKFSTLKDTVLANNYCKDFFSKDLLKFASIRKSIADIRSISDTAKRTESMKKFIDSNYDESQEYYKFMNTYTLMVAKVLQSLQIVSYNGNKLESLADKWKVYTENMSASIWNVYNKICEDYPFGLNNEVEVYSNRLNKKLVRNISFQLSDFISADRKKDDDRYTVLFD